LPCDIRVKVEVLTPLCSATFRQVSFLACRWASSAAKNAAPSNRARLAIARSSRSVAISQSAITSGSVRLPHPIQVTERELTGREIKQAAIDQGVNIGLDFVLYEHLGQQRTRIVGDDEPVRIHPGSRFEALANDDNS
jgi:hypothetical protein